MPGHQGIQEKKEMRKSYLRDEVDEWLGSQLLNALLIQTGQVVELSFFLCFATRVKGAVLWRQKRRQRLFVQLLCCKCCTQENIDRLQ